MELGLYEMSHWLHFVWSQPALDNVLFYCADYSLFALDAGRIVEEKHSVHPIIIQGQRTARIQASHLGRDLSSALFATQGKLCSVVEAGKRRVFAIGNHFQALKAF